MLLKVMYDYNGTTEEFMTNIQHYLNQNTHKNPRRFSAFLHGIPLLAIHALLLELLKANAQSARVIQKCGGALENEVVHEFSPPNRHDIMEQAQINDSLFFHIAPVPQPNSNTFAPLSIL